MKVGEMKKLSSDYPTKVSHKNRKVIAQAGDSVRLFADHNDVWVVELKNKERISVQTKYIV